jgi:peptide chain release factor subunit 1
VTELDREFVKKLAGWSGNGIPVSSLYLDVDGRRYPRRQDYELRADQLCHRLREDASGRAREARRSVERDSARITSFIREMDRGPTRGVALFSSHSAGLWEDVLLPRPVPDKATLAERPYVLPLETILETQEAFCTVLVDREKARIFLSRLGRIREQTGVFDDVPGQHDQGGWSQARYQRHIEEHVGKHLKHVAEVLLRFFKRRGFDHLIVAGPEEVVPEFERDLHDYLRRRIVGRTTLAMTATPEEVLERSLAIEEVVERTRQGEVLQRLQSEAAAGRHAVTGLPAVLGALSEGRVEALVVPFGFEADGFRCTSCGRLAMRGRTCPTCRGPLEPITDVVERAVALALQQNARVETIRPANNNDNGEGQLREVGALLRY